ncbi:MAG: SGNH/GDSL hydrolase family protein [Phycisphaerae bacterium]
MKKIVALCLAGAFALTAQAVQYEKLDINSYLDGYNVVKAPEQGALMLKKGDRLAICGDSITEQKIYSRIIEAYLTVCTPQLEITTRQYGWGGEQAGGFLGRMDNDCLRFKPTIATTCYGMNDFHYVPFDENACNDYYNNTTKIVEKFKAAGTRVLVGSSGSIGKRPWWQNKDINNDDLNRSLAKFRNTALKVAQEQNVAFADVFTPMLLGSYKALTLYGIDFHLNGDDGVHPDWAGHIVMAYAFLKGLGLDGELATISVDAAAGKAEATAGHEITSSSFGNSITINLHSTRYPYCDDGEPAVHTSGRAGMTIVPFNEELNRYMLKASGLSKGDYKVKWGQWEKTYSSEQLADGVNLAADYVSNPFCEPFRNVLEAVKRKQEYETTQIKSLFHGDEGKADMEATVALTEKVHDKLARELADSFKPVDHTITITAL